MVCCFRKIHLKWPHFWANSKCSHGTSIDAQGIFLQKICVFCHHLAIYPIHFSRLRERKIQFRQENCFSMFMWWSLYTSGLVGILSEPKGVIWILSKKWGIFTSMTIPKFYFIPSKKTFLFKTWNATLITFIGRFTPIVNIWRSINFRQRRQGNKGVISTAKVNGINDLKSPIHIYNK